MRLPLSALRLLTAAALVLAASGLATAESIIAYYPFESGSPGGTTPDEYSDNDLTLESSKTSIDSMGMFGNALKTTAVTGYAQLADGDPDFDTTYTKLSVSLWAYQSSWSVSGFGAHYLTGKYATGDQRGWQMNVKGGEINQIVFGGYESASGTSSSQNVTTAFTTALDASVFHHICGTFDAAGEMRIYVDGILAASATTTIDSLNGSNTNPFQVANRGLTATSTTSGGGFVGSIDDYLIAAGDVITAQQVALIHGLGRLAGVSMASGDSVGDEISDVLAAYGSQGSAMAGGQTWRYMSNVGGGTTVGAIGGSVAEGNAYIVLGTDGSGIMLVPEPGALVSLFSVFMGMLFFRRPR